jgi:dTDP-4-dehydrorhamnose reductase
MRILLTGANGLVGQKIKENLSARENTELIATSLNDEINPLDRNYTFEKFDITKPDEASDILNRYSPDVLINTAAEARVNHCEQHKSSCWEVNTLAVQYLVKYCNIHKIQLIQLSTDFVFNGSLPEYDEEDTSDPLSYYGVTKKEAEDYIMKNCNEWTIIRTILVYGYFKGMKKDNIVTWVIKSLKENKPIRVVTDQYRCPTLAEDLAEAVSRAALNRKNGIFNISGREMYSVNEIAQFTAEYFNLDERLIQEISTIELNEPAPRPKKTKFNLLKSEKELNFLPCSLQEGLNLIEKQLNGPNIEN